MTTLDVAALLADLTLTEKAALTSGSAFWFTAPIPRAGVPAIMVSDGPHGMRVQPREADHLGLGSSLPATCFPTACALASSWDPELLTQVGAAIGQEALAMKVSVVLGPGVNMKRSPLCGRNFEYFSEDPYLAGELAVGMVQGIQSRGVGTSVKHFAANNQETDRLRVDAQADERTLREIYLPAFERVVTATQPWTIMCAYNKINAVSASENHWLLTEVLRDEWGFDGLVVSDWGAVYHRVPALAAGLDLEMPPALPRSPAEIVSAVESGEMAPEVLDLAVRRVLELVAKAMPALEQEATFDEGDHHALARRAAAESAVLLVNDGLLPLEPATSVALIGEFARTPRFQGAGSSQVSPTRVEKIVDELSAACASLTFAPGYGIGDTSQDDTLLAEAVDAARAADTVVLVIGLPAADESEGFDRTHMRLPDNQLAALRSVAAANPNVAVVLVNGSAVELGEVLPHARALVEAWLGGQAAAGGIVDVLTGEVNPSGRLAETIPVRLEDCTAYLNFPGDSQQVRYGEGIFIGYRGYDKQHSEVAFPFGHGLSYTSFETSSLVVALGGSVADGTLSATVSFTVKNTGSRAGAHVAQVYLRDLAASVTREVRALKGFAKVRLEPGESRHVAIRLDQRAFSYWSHKHHRWVVEAGEFAIEVGDNSRRIVASETVSVDAPRLVTNLTPDSTLDEWMDDPLGRHLIEREIAAGAPGDFLDPVMRPVVGAMPMSTLANFGDQGLDHAALDRIAEEWAEKSGL